MNNLIPQLPAPQCNCPDIEDRVNASQIKQWEECNRKWGFDNLLPQDPYAQRGSAATSLGSRVHKVAEKYFTRGTGFFTVDYTDREAADIFTSALPYLPTNQNLFYHVEEHVTVGKLWHGTIDLWYRDTQGVVQLYDWKTTSDFKWAKTETDLLVDPQAMLYAEAIGAKELHWIYMRTKGSRQAQPTNVTEMAENQSRDMLETFVPTANLILKNRLNTPKTIDRFTLQDYINTTLTPNTGACNNYGGCPHQSYCRFTNPFAQLKKDRSDMGILDTLKSVAPAVPATIAPPVAINPPSHTPTPIIDKGLWVKRGAEGGILGIEELMKGVEEAYISLLQLAPSGWFSSFEAPQSLVAPPVEALEAVAAKYPELAAKAAEQQPETMTAPRKRGRPAGSKNAIKTEVEDTEDKVQYFLAEPESELETGLRKSVEKTIRTLYIDCSPTMYVSDSYALLIQAAKTNVAQKFEVSDYRFMDYGKGNGAFAQAFAEVFESHSTFIELSVDTRLAETSLVLSYLISKAADVVRSFR